MSNSEKFNPCDAAIEDLVSALEAVEASGDATTWVKSWVTSEVRNAASGTVWTGFNPIRAAIHNYLHGYTDDLFVTFKGAHALGGHVRKGERGCVFIRPLIGKRKDDDGTEHVFIRGFAYFKAWNLEQCDGIKPEKVEQYRATAEGADVVPDADAVFAGLGVPLRHGGGAAYYSPAEDAITMPDPSTFKGTDEYYQTLFHEGAHATGHKSRLNRFEVNKDESVHPYAHEELVAELAGFAVTVSLGLEPDKDNSIAYLRAWKNRIQEHPADEMVAALGKARTAARWILDPTTRTSNKVEANK